MSRALTRTIKTSLVIGVGLLLALAATVGPPPSPGSAPGASLAVRIPDSVRAATLVLLALSAVILLAVQRRPRATEQALVHAQAPRRMSALAMTVMLATLALAVYLIWNRWSGEDGHPIETAFTAIAELFDLLSRSRKPAASLPLFDATLAVLVLLVAFGIFVLMVLIAFAERLDRWWSRPPASVAALASPPPGAESLDDPRAESDPRRAIVAAWRRLEHALAAVRAPRAPWQTPTEFMRTTLARLPLPAPPVERLTALFQLARFSDRPLSAQAREAACDSLDEITTALSADPARER